MDNESGKKDCCMITNKIPELRFDELMKIVCYQSSPTFKHTNV